jgi:hypothetical protein
VRAGYVTKFEVEDTYVSRLEPHIVGSREHEELWIPAEELAEFNTHIRGKIRVIEAYFGEGFTGYIPERFGLAGKNTSEQFISLAGSWNIPPSTLRWRSPPTVLPYSYTSLTGLSATLSKMVLLLSARMRCWNVFNRHRLNDIQICHYVTLRAADRYGARMLWL